MLPWIHKDRIFELRNVLKDRNLLSAAQLLEKLNIYVIACDARDTGLEGSSIDFFVSNNTLEHIPEDVIQSIFTEFRRLAAGRAVMSHFIDMGDHYANFDRNITPYNFLKYPNYVWRLFNNSLQYQNRLRMSDYRRIHQVTGFKIASEHNEKRSPENLDNIRIAKEFRHYPRDELLVVSTWMVSHLEP